MRMKEEIISYLAHVCRANRNQIAEAIRADPQTVSSRLVELRRAGIVRYVDWADGNKVWILTKEGGERFDYYTRRDRKRRQDGDN